MHVDVADSNGEGDERKQPLQPIGSLGARDDRGDCLEADPAAVLLVLPSTGSAERLLEVLLVAYGARPGASARREAYSSSQSMSEWHAHEDEVLGGAIPFFSHVGGPTRAALPTSRNVADG